MLLFQIDICSHCIKFFFRQLVAKEDGSLLKEGDILKMPKLANTLQKIAEDPFTFYNGSLANDIVNDIAEEGSFFQ